MQVLVDRVATATGLEPSTAETAVGMILQFLAKETPGPEVDRLLDAIPGARESLAGLGDPAAAGGGLFGLFGGGGVMALGSRLMSAGVPMTAIEPLGRELFAYGREVAGEDTVEAVVAGVPGLTQLL